MPNLHASRLVLACLACGLAGSGVAEQADRDKPIHVEADTATVSQKDKNNKSTLLERNVRMTQGTMEVLADRATIRENAAGEQSVTAEGNPVKFRQKLDGDQGWMDGRSDRLEYNSARNEARLIGHAYLKRAEDEARGEVITYNTEASEWKVISGPASGTKDGRVEFVIQPRKKPVPAQLPAKPAQ